MTLHTPLHQIAPAAQLTPAPTVVLPVDFFIQLKTKIVEAFEQAERDVARMKANGERCVFADGGELFQHKAPISLHGIRAILMDQAHTLPLVDIVKAAARYGLMPAHIDLDEFDSPLVWHPGDAWHEDVASDFLSQINTRGPEDKDGNATTVNPHCIVIPHAFWETLRETIRNDPNAREKRTPLYVPKGEPYTPSYIWHLTTPKRLIFFTLTRFVQRKQQLDASVALILAEHYGMRFDVLFAGSDETRITWMGATCDETPTPPSECEVVKSTFERFAQKMGFNRGMAA